MRECAAILLKIFKLETRVVRYHNIYGPLWVRMMEEGEKAPAAICRKVIECKIEKKVGITMTSMGGDGEQTRSVLYIDDCIEGTMKSV